jgi:hypothetical protein
VLAAVPVDWVATSLPADAPAVLLARHRLRCFAGQSWEWDGVRFTVFDNSMPPVFIEALGKHLFEQRETFGQRNTEHGAFWVAAKQLDQSSFELGAVLRAKVIEKAAEAAAKLAIALPPERPPSMLPMLLHHGCALGWQPEPDLASALLYEFTLHSEPKMFSGGELEFVDGGSLENRMRLVLRVAEQLRRLMPDEMPLFTRISATDWVQGGWDIEQSVILSRELKARGVDLIDVSSGALVPTARIPVAKGYQVPFARRA